MAFKRRLAWRTPAATLQKRRPPNRCAVRMRPAGFGAQVAYCASKGALLPLSKSLAVAWGPDNIQASTGQAGGQKRGGRHEQARMTGTRTLAHHRRICPPPWLQVNCLLPGGEAGRSAACAAAPCAVHACMHA